MKYLGIIRKRSVSCDEVTEAALRFLKRRNIITASALLRQAAGQRLKEEGYRVVFNADGEAEVVPRSS